INENAFCTGVVTQIAQINEDPDGFADNRFMWEFSAITPALTDGDQFRIIAHIQGGTDELLVQYTSALGPVAHNAPILVDRDFQPAHTAYFRAETPLEGETLILSGSDEIEIKWSGFKRDDNAGDLWQGFIVPAGVDAAAAILNAGDWDALVVDAGVPETYLADWYMLNGIDGGSDPSLGTVGQDISTGKFSLDVSDLTKDMFETTVNPSGFYDLWYFTTYDADIDAELPVKAPGVLRFTGSTAATTSFSLQPNSGYLAKGDTVTVSVIAQSAGALNVDLLTVEIDLPDTYFTVLDQGSGAPFVNESVNFNGSQLVNKMVTAGGVTSLSYAERDASPSEDLNAADLAVLTFQIVATTAASGTELLDQLVTFVNSGTRITGIVDQNGNQEALTLASPAANFQAAPPGGLKGEVALEVLTDNGQTVDFWVTRLGSYTPITDADFLDANGGANSDGSVTVTLGTDGAYTLISIPTGDYDVKVHKDFHLDQLSSNVAIRPAFAATLDFNGSDMLLAGDISGYDHDGDASTAQIPDNQIEAADIDAVSAAFGSTSADDNWFAPADLDGDGTVYILDYNTIVSNSGTNGEGPVFKVRTGENEAVVNLLAISQIGDEYTFAIELSNLTSLHAYAAEMNINPQEWELVSFSDGMSSFGRSVALDMSSGYNWTFASALSGRGGDITSSEIEMLTFTLRASVSDPEPITIEEVTLVAGNGSASMALVSNPSDTPTEYVLSQNYPNPFNPSTTINFSLPESGQVKLAVYNLLGQEVRQLVSGDLGAGNYRAIWSGMDNTGRKVSSGLYFYRLVVDNRVIDTRKMAFLK
ncbi:MAG: T9SS type A sorting domain-containing protein, partial [Candidatus Marinimicrobia bacterium]|nr:T9SS type A sorting domain-containing protein [Candidatus Neomarinimicrobiota bacterium]